MAQERFHRIVMVVPGGSDTIQCWEACLSALGEALAQLSEGEPCAAGFARQALRANSISCRNCV